MSKKVSLVFGIFLVGLFASFWGGMPASNVSANTSEAEFLDVQEEYWANQEIYYLFKLSIIKGYTAEDGTSIFNPSNNVTRAQAAKMVIKALGESESLVEESSFTDVPTDHWASGYIERATELGIFGGYGNGKFGPNDTLKRSQMSKILSISFALSNKQAAANLEDGVQIFKDVKESYWASEYIYTLYHNGISNGSNYEFRPEEIINRAQFSAFLTRTLDEGYRLTPKPPYEPLIATGKVTVDLLNVRKGPSTDFDLIGQALQGEVLEITALDGYWARVRYGSTHGYVHKTYLKLRNVEGGVVENRIIVVDAGHGDHDPGASSNGAIEKEVVLAVSKQVAQKLEAAGATVLMTREDNTFLSLDERVQVAKQNYAELFVSIHANAAGFDAGGTEVFYDTSENDNGEESAILAEYIQNRIVDMANMYDRGTKDNRFYVIRNNNIPSVLVELGFLTNSEDAEKLKSAEFQSIFADAIYKGIIDYYKE